jgi:acyl carrier protein
LPAPLREDFANEEYAAPKGEIEELLAQVWQEVLQVERVGRYSHFIELGGHSMTAMRLVVKLAEILGVQLQLQAVLRSPTLWQMAEVVESVSFKGQALAAARAESENGTTEFEEGTI